MLLSMPGCLAASAACPTCSTRCASMSGAKHSCTLPTGKHHTEPSVSQSPRPGPHDMWMASTELLATSSAGWTGSFLACGTIRSRAVWQTLTRASASTSASRAPALTRFTSPLQTVASSGSTQRSLCLPGRIQNLPLASTVPSFQRCAHSA